MNKSNMKKLVDDICNDTHFLLTTYNNEIKDWRDDLCGGCAVGARIIQLTGKKLGYKTDIYAGKFKPNSTNSHCWATWEEYLVDPTATQYNRPPTVTKYKYKYLYEPWIKGPYAVKELNTKWQVGERLFEHRFFISESVKTLVNTYKVHTR